MFNIVIQANYVDGHRNSVISRIKTKIDGTYKTDFSPGKDFYFKAQWHWTHGLHVSLRAIMMSSSLLERFV